MRSRTLPALTGLRFVAALSVVLFHLLPRQTLAPWAAKTADFGYVTVGVFFVLSGFVLAYAYPGRAEWVPFLRARFARIYPVYALAMLVALPLFLETAQNLPDKVGPLPWEIASRFLMVQAWNPATMVHYNVPSWSLSCEAFFYLLFPIVVPLAFKITPRDVIRSLVMVGALAVLVPVVFNWAFPGISPASESAPVLLVKFHPLVRLPEFLVGVLLGRLFAAGVPKLLDWQADAFLAGALFWTLGMVAADVPYLVLHTGGLVGPSCLAIWGLASGKGVAAKTLSLPLVVLLGEASYALYILHVPVARHLTNWGFDPQSIVESVIRVLFVIAVSVLVYLKLERPARIALRKEPDPIFSPRLES